MVTTIPADGMYPFADKRFPMEELALVEPTPELTELIERELSIRDIAVPTDILLEINLESSEFATASFVVQRGEDGRLLMLIPTAVLRKPN